MEKYDYNDINIVYEDNHILVVVKPQNLPTCGDASGDDNLLDCLKRYLVDKYNKPGEAYLGLLHRLDRPTGGVMVFAKTSKAASRLSDDIRNGEFDKRYLAVTVGTPREKKGTLKNGLMKDTEKNMVRCVPILTEGAKLAVLDYKVVESKSELCLLDINLLTGRSHQARVQLNFMGTPIFGDYRYGANKSPQGYNLALWAYELRFPHPITKEIMVFRVNPPQEETPWKFFDINTKLQLIK